MSYLVLQGKMENKNLLTCIDRNRRLGPNRGADAPLGGAPPAAQ